VTQGNKSIKIARNTNTVNADVIPCLQYRKYSRFVSIGNEDYHEGILYWTVSERNEIISYPKNHHNKMTEKNQSTNQWFKRTVRIFKNARSFMEGRGILPQ